MSKLLERKWRIAACLALTFALASDFTAKKFAGMAMTSIARHAAGLPADANVQSQVRFSGIADNVGLCVALFALVCWGISGYRREPGSSLAVVILAVLYGHSFLIMV